MILAKIEKAKELSLTGLSNSKIGDTLELDRHAIPYLLELYDEMKKAPIVMKDLVCAKKRLMIKRSIKIQHKLADFRAAHKVRLEQLKKRKAELIQMGYDLKHFDDLNDEIKIQQQTIVRTINQYEHVEAELYEHKKYYYWEIAISFMSGMALMSVIVWAYVKFVL